MKTLWMVLHNIKKTYKKHFFFLCLILLSMSISSFGIFFYAGYLGETSSMIQQDMGDTLFLETISEKLPQELMSVFDYAKERGVNYIRIHNQKGEELLKTSTGINPNEDSNEIPIQFIGEYNQKYGDFLLTGRNLTYDERGAVVLIPQFYATYLDYEETPLNSKIPTEEEEFTIVGILSYTDNDVIIVPLQYYLHHLEGNYVEIQFAQKFSSMERMEINRYIGTKDFLTNFSWKLVKSPFLSFDFWFEFSQIFLIFVVISINIFVILYFLVLRMRDVYSIYSVCGGKKNHILSIITIQNYLLLALGILIGLFIFIAFYEWSTPFGLIYHENFVFYLSIYLMVNLVVLILTFVTCLKLSKHLIIYKKME